MSTNFIGSFSAKIETFYKLYKLNIVFTSRDLFCWGDRQSGPANEGGAGPANDGKGFGPANDRMGSAYIGIQ